MTITLPIVSPLLGDFETPSVGFIFGLRETPIMRERERERENGGGDERDGVTHQNKPRWATQLALQCACLLHQALHIEDLVDNDMDTNKPNRH